MERDRKQSIQQELKKLYKAPKPDGKRQFMEQYRKRREEQILGPVNDGKTGDARGRAGSFDRKPLSICHMMAIQCTYLTKWVWVVTAAVLGISLYAGARFQAEGWWAACACVPFLGMTAITAAFRSKTWDMAQLEQASRFSLRSIVAARIGILGMGNLLCLLVMCIWMNTAGGRQLLFLLVPYLFTSFGCLVITRRITGREGIYASAGVASAVSCMEMVLHGMFPWIMEKEYTNWWLAVAVGMLVLAIREWNRSITKMEELSWS